jgi:hypothetical protein
MTTKRRNLLHARDNVEAAARRLLRDGDGPQFESEHKAAQWYR